MMIIYFFIALLATTVGAMAGLGGGVIIKPLLDLLGDFNVSTISVLSSVTVFSMAIVSITKQIRYKFKIEYRKTILIGFGSIIGGIIGQKVLKWMLTISNGSKITIIQNSILLILLISVYIFMNNRNKFKTYNISGIFPCIFIGIGLGCIASFLSIGGGPINVCVLTLFFSMGAKEAAVNSIVTILFSQGATLFSIATTTGFGNFNLSVMPSMIVGGILGGILGSRCNKVVKESYILKLFNCVVISLIMLNFYNMTWA